MFDPALFAAFLVAINILTITPGVDTAMVLRSAAAEGARSAVFAGAGILLGCLIWGAAVSLGFGALLRVSELAYTAVKWAGAAYLVWLGAQMLLKPRQSLGEPGAAPPPSAAVAFRRGLLTNLLNPKIGVFYVTFLPQFVPPSASEGANVAGFTFFLVGVHVALTIVWFAGLILATAPLGRFLRRPAVVRTMDRVVGAIFIGFGLKLAASRV